MTPKSTPTVKLPSAAEAAKARAEAAAEGQPSTEIAAAAGAAAPPPAPSQPTREERNTATIVVSGVSQALQSQMPKMAKSIGTEFGAQLKEHMVPVANALAALTTKVSTLVETLERHPASSAPAGERSRFSAPAGDVPMDDADEAEEGEDGGEDDIPTGEDLADDRWTVVGGACRTGVREIAAVMELDQLTVADFQPFLRTKVLQVLDVPKLSRADEQIIHSFLMTMEHEGKLAPSPAPAATQRRKPLGANGGVTKPPHNGGGGGGGNPRGGHGGKPPRGGGYGGKQRGRSGYNGGPGRNNAGAGGSGAAAADA